jgi:tetratricopeptide (TPR) repeat protein
MTEINLRSYIRDIDRLIEQENLDEAIAHCRHILQNYPKYIECYRLLGKAYLEAKRYGDAADIFQRVLSAVPDDFVSHIGMSIVREDEGNLESSIWHMERAFETNPANPALQQELKRLIGRRDGVEPHKVRLTRGALARMYAHGELFPQAIAELLSALKEETDRPDLQVLLADMYWQTEQRMEAAEVAGRILERLPFCLKALQITAAVLQERGKAEEAGAYHRRLAQLDPYLAFIEIPMADSSRVDADSIEIEKLAWQPGQPLPSAEAGPADWAASLGLDEEELAGTGTGPLPSWLSDIEDLEEAEAAEPTGAPFAQAEEPAQAPAEPAAEGEIPDWMQEAGWQEATGEAQEGPVSFSPSELESLEHGELPPEVPPAEPSGELEPAEIPGWLQGMAPEAGAEEAESVSEEDAELAAILGGGQDAAAAAPEDIEEAAPEAEGAPEAEAADVPSWLDEGEPGATSTIMTWLGEREPEGEGAEPQEASPAEELPDWMREAPDFGTLSTERQTAQPEAEPEAGDEVPAWLSGVAEAAAEAGESEEAELERFREQVTPDVEPEPSEPAGGPVPDWLQAITGEEPAAPDSADETGELAVEAEAEVEAEVEAVEQEVAPASDQPAPEGGAEEAPPDWIAGLGEEAEAQPQAAGEPTAEDWLAGMGEEQEAAAGEGDEATAWLEELGSDETAMAAQEAPATIPDWMSGLEEEPEPTEPEVEELASSWLEGLSETLEETPAEPSVATGPEADVSDWLGSVADEEPEEPTEAPAYEEEGTQPTHAAAEEAEDLSWLSELESQASAQAGRGAEPAPAAADLENLDEEGIFNWLDQLAQQPDTGEGLGGLGPEEGEPEQEVELSETAPPESLEEGLEWLDRLSESRGIDADISREPAAGTPSEETTPGAAPPEGAQSQMGAEGAGLWEPEAATADEAPTPEEPEREAVDLESIFTETAEIPEAEEAASIFDELDAAEPEVAAEAPTPESIFDEESIPEPTAEAAPPSDEAEVGAVEEAAFGAIEEPPPESTLEEPAWYGETEPPEEPVVQQPVGETPEPADEEEEVPDWLKAHAESAQYVEEPEPEEPEPAPPSIPPAPAPEPTAEAREPEPSRGAPIEKATPIEEAPAQEVAPEAPPEPEVPSVSKVEPAVEPSPVAEVEARPAAEAEQEPEAEEEAEPEPAEIETAAEPSVEQPPVAEPVEPEPVVTDPTLLAAREALAEGDQAAALANYNRLIKGKRQLDHVIEDLEAALEQEPDAPGTWQALGDAYMRLGRTKEAVQAYGRGMEEAEVLDSARQALATGNFDQATAQYSMLIKRGKQLEGIIEDLENALEESGASPALWQTLGDAYMKADRVNDSIEAYRRGMESV